MFEPIIVLGVDGRSHAFSGRLLCDVSDSIGMTEWDERSIKLKLFAMEEGGFIGVIELDSSNYSYASVQEAAELDDRIQVENFFLAFDPTIHVSYSRQRLSEPRMIHRISDLMSMHQQLTESVLIALNEYLAVVPDCERLTDSEEIVPDHFRKLFGLV